MHSLAYPQAAHQRCPRLCVLLRLVDGGFAVVLFEGFITSLEEPLLFLSVFLEVAVSRSD